VKAVPSTTASVSGVGWIFGGGSKLFAFSAVPPANQANPPVGNRVFYDLANVFQPIAIQSSAYSTLEIPVDQNIATLSGTCLYKGNDGYKFTLVAEDLGENFFWIFNNQDKLHLSVTSTSDNAAVYDAQMLVNLGYIVITR
jgi:hypothetical protein